MAFFQRNQSPMLPNQPQRQQEPREKKPMSKQDKIWMAWLLGSTVVSTLLYFGLVALSEHMATLLAAQIMGVGAMIAYAVAGTIFLVTFIIYNRAFTRDNITLEMLPDSMSEHEKAAFIQDGVQRKRKSKWMIIVIIALFVPLAIDFIILIAAPTLLTPIFGQYFGG